jgi:DNA-binding winged helix-turn-helix (wHTH) protein
MESQATQFSHPPFAFFATGMTSASRFASTPRIALDRMHETLVIPPRRGAAESVPPPVGGPTLFCGLRFEADGSLFSGETLIHLPPRELTALRLLLANAGQVVTHAQFKKVLWGDVHVTADSVPRCLSSLRARLGSADCIQTVYKRGYRLTAKVHTHKAPLAALFPRLAILPFTGETGVPEHLGSAIAEETIAHLSNAATPPASILARDSVFALSQRGFTAQQIGRTLNADLVLTGTLRALSSHYRLRAEMIRVADGIQIWVEDLIVERGRIAGLESDLATQLGFRLRTSPLDSVQGAHRIHLQPRAALAPPPEQTPAEPSAAGPDTGSPSISTAEEPAPSSDFDSPRREAYEVFRRGHYEWQTLQRHRMQDGMQYLMRAIELDPSLIAAKVDLVRLCVTQSIFGYMSPRVAAKLLNRTVESIPDLPQRAPSILPSLGWTNFHVDYDLQAALRAFSFSAHLPHDTFTTRERWQFALSRHRFDEVVFLLQDALLQDPYAPWLHARPRLDIPPGR